MFHLNKTQQIMPPEDLLYLKLWILSYGGTDQSG